MHDSWLSACDTVHHTVTNHEKAATQCRSEQRRLTAELLDLGQSLPRPRFGLHRRPVGATRCTRAGSARRTASGAALQRALLCTRARQTEINETKERNGSTDRRRG